MMTKGLFAVEVSGLAKRPVNASAQPLLKVRVEAGLYTLNEL